MRKLMREFWFGVADVFFFAGFYGSAPYRWAMRRALECAQTMEAEGRQWVT